MASPLHSSSSLLSSSAERLSLAPATLIKLALSVRAWSARTGSAMVGRAGSEAHKVDRGRRPAVGDGVHRGGRLLARAHDGSSPSIAFCES